jgi:hypothetical protein
MSSPIAFLQATAGEARWGRICQVTFSCLNNGKHPLEVLPQLQEPIYSVSGDTGDAFTSFIVACQNLVRPVTLVHAGPRYMTPLS